jgi:hypothetical protein
VSHSQYFSHPSLVIYFFAPPPIKWKLRLQIGGRLLIANYLHQSETRSKSQILFITLFSAAQLCCTFYQPQQTVQIWWGPKPFPWAKPACFHFSSCNFNVQGHILNTARDGFRSSQGSGEGGFLHLLLKSGLRDIDGYNNYVPSKLWTRKFLLLQLHFPVCNQFLGQYPANGS